MPSASTPVGSAARPAAAPTAPRAARGPSAAAGRCRARGCAAPAPLPADRARSARASPWRRRDRCRRSGARGSRSPPARPGAAARRRAGRARCDAAARRRPRRCAAREARSSSAWRRTSSSDSCSAESSFTLCSASPTWRAELGERLVVGLVELQRALRAAHDDHAEQLAGVGDRRDPQHLVVWPVMTCGSQMLAHAAPDTPARAIDGLLLARRARSSPGPRSGTDTARSRPSARAARPHLGDAERTSSSSATRPAAAAARRAAARA